MFAQLTVSKSNVTTFSFHLETANMSLVITQIVSKEKQQNRHYNVFHFLRRHDYQIYPRDWTFDISSIFPWDVDRMKWIWINCQYKTRSVDFGRLKNSWMQTQQDNKLLMHFAYIFYPAVLMGIQAKDSWSRCWKKQRCGCCLLKPFL